MIALAGEERKEEVRRENNLKMSRNKEGVPLSEIRAQPGSAQDPRPKTTRSGSFLWDTYGQVGVHGWKRSHVIKSVLHFLRGNRTKIRRRKLVSRINLV
jgi:hypothetical protein